jgi:Flp pilus assembly protein TadG
VPDTAGGSASLRSTQRRARLRGDDGSTTVEMAILFPVLLILLMTIVQAGMWWHARNLALAAAEAGVQVARTTTGTSQSAQSAAVSYLERAGGSATTDATVQAEVTAELARVQVSATASRVLPVPGLEMRVSQTAQARREAFTTPGGSP